LAIVAVAKAVPASDVNFFTKAMRWNVMRMISWNEYPSSSPSVGRL
jgi:hypothetical protein